LRELAWLSSVPGVLAGAELKDWVSEMGFSSEDRVQTGGRRNEDRMFMDVGARMAWHGRTMLVNDVLQARLGALDRCRWHFVRGFSICSTPIPFVLFGPTGVFLLQASRGYWSARDVVDMNRAANTLRDALSGYPDPVHSGVVVLDDNDLSPRQYFAPDQDSSSEMMGPCWVLGDAMLLEWLYSFRDRGLSQEDITLLRAWGSPERVTELRRTFAPANDPNGLS
jgi:hypothetical protein